ncbi:PD-(D/E)XK nuclease family protein [Sphingomonas rhizophila]|uniref:PD-(D/E)XK nuclease family protein n=1 Tax=Sphingomonas rhizophila TaxID=2071607 RepID=UPI0031B5D3F2
MRLAANLGRALDALTIEEVDPSRLRRIIPEAASLAEHWQQGLARFDALAEQWPRTLSGRGEVDLATRRGILLRRMAERWRRQPPTGFTIAAGITTAAPAVAALLASVARMQDGAVVLPALSLRDSMPDAEWEMLGPDEDGRGEERHPQFHLKLLLDRIGVARDEVRMWHGGGRAASPAVRGRAVAHAMTAAEFSDKWSSLPLRERRLTGIRCVELADPASESQAIAISLREAIEIPGQTAALVTPDRGLAARVSAHLTRWGISADDSAGQPLSQTPAGTFLLAMCDAVEQQLAPVALLALLKHPLIGGEGDDRRQWLDRVRSLDLALRGPRPPAGMAGLDGKIDQILKAALRRILTAFGTPGDLAALAESVRAAAMAAGDSVWRGPAGRSASDLLEKLEQSTAARALHIEPGEWTAILRHLLDGVAVRRPFGGHPRIAIWGLLEARLQHADFLVLGGLNEGVWPAVPTPDPWLAPAIRRLLGIGGLETRIGLAAHDFASALGAPRVLLTRAKRDGRSPTVASRFWRRLQAMTGGLTRDIRLERLARSVDAAGVPVPAAPPMPRPKIDQRPKEIAVTDLDRLNADPFAFYARAILKLYVKEPVDADQTAAWKGTAVHDVFQKWYDDDGCDPAKLVPRAEALLGDENIHPMLRALWAPRLLEAIGWAAREMADDLDGGRRPIAAELAGQAEVAGVTLKGRVDRIDALPDGRIAIVDYKTGKAPSQKAVDEGFALQLGLLSLIAEAGGFEGICGQTGAHEYWSLAKDGDSFGKRVAADKQVGPEDFVRRALVNFKRAVDDYLLGDKPFEAKLNPAYAPYGDYDQLMRLEEWYGRERSA